MTTHKFKIVVICVLDEDGTITPYWGGDIKNYMENFSLSRSVEFKYHGGRDEIISVNVLDDECFVNDIYGNESTVNLRQIKPCRFENFRKVLTDNINEKNKKEIKIYDVQVILYSRKTKKIYSSHLNSSDEFYPLPSFTAKP